MQLLEHDVGAGFGAGIYLGLKSELEQTGASIAIEQPLRHGAATGLAFMLAAAAPLLSYLAAGWRTHARLLLALLLAAVVLFVVGGARASCSAARCPVRSRCLR